MDRENTEITPSEAPAVPAEETFQSHLGSVRADMEKALEQIGSPVLDDRDELEAEPAAETATAIGSEDGQESLDLEAEPESSDAVAQAYQSWEPVFNSLGISHDQVVENYGRAVVALQQDPVTAIANLAKAYIPADQAQTVLAALATQYGIDPFDVDVDDYQNRQPQMQAQSELAQMRARMISMELTQMRGSGKYPLLDNQAVQQQMSQALSANPGATLEDAYNAALVRNPGLLQEHIANATGKSVPAAPVETPAEADEKRRNKLRRATAADLPRGTAGSAPTQAGGKTVLDAVREAAAQIGFGAE